MLAIVVGVIVLLAAVSGSGITLVIAVVVSLLGFIGSASLAKLLPQGPPMTRRGQSAAHPA